MCNIFNDYFIAVGKNLADSIRNCTVDPLSYMGNRTQNTFYFENTTAAEVDNIISSFRNKKTNLNNIPTFVIKKISHILSPLLVTLFNESILQGTFPTKLKLGRVIPLHKSGSQTAVSNYRPITTLSIFSKIFEKLVHKRLVKFIDKYEIINKNQFGFQKSKSTSDAILEFLDNVYDSFDRDNHLLAIFLDFSKAFDTISHDILLSKLEFLGFRGPINSWLGSYLRGRKQFVSVGDEASVPKETSIGVPQGSTLGPLLFILYINDMKKCLKTMKVLHFADDSTLYCAYDLASMSNLINADLVSVNTWLSANKLFLNIDKTKYITFRNRKIPPPLDLKIGSSVVCNTNAHKFLGVHIDENLNFKAHINRVSSKVASGVGMIRSISPFVPKSILRQLHFAFVHSKFTYALTSYGTSSQNQLRRISNLVNKSIKLCTGASRVTLDICISEKFFDLNMAHKYFSCLKMYQVLEMNFHPYFWHKLRSFQITHSHATRRNAFQKLSIPYVRLAKCQRSFLFTGIKFWNELPLNIRNSSNLKKFKSDLKKFIFT